MAPDFYLHISAIGTGPGPNRVPDRSDSEPNQSNQREVSTYRTDERPDPYDCGPRRQADSRLNTRLWTAR